MSPTLSHHFLTMAYNNAWANHRLLKACSKLAQAEFVASRTGFFPSIKATLNHILIVDWFYLDALEREMRGDEPNQQGYAFFADEEPCSTCNTLHQAQGEADRRLIQYCERLHDAELNRYVTIPRHHDEQRDTRARLLAHLFQHQIHHRGQAHAMLAETSVKPPQLDEFFCEGEHPLRAEEFKELGWSEDMIWSAPRT